MFLPLFVCLFIYIAQFNATHVAQNASQSQTKNTKKSNDAMSNENMTTSHKLIDNNPIKKILHLNLDVVVVLT